MRHPVLVSPHEIIRSGLCIGCGVCVLDEGRMELDVFGSFKPVGTRHWLHEATLKFSSVCPFSPSALDEDELAEEIFAGLPKTDQRLGKMQQAFVGHVVEDGFRERGSSGGMVSWVLSELLRTGKIDAAVHVVPGSTARLFHYRVSRTAESIEEGAKSRYYPIELSEVLRTIRAAPGRYAVVGVPCFIKAIRLCCRADPLLRERIRYTLGLFCGHMKSARLIESFAWQMGTDITEVLAADYRRKDESRPASAYTAELLLKNGETRARDWWNMPDGDWGAGFFQNSACNYCDDVVAETADVSFGDAWVEPYTSDGRGTNVVIARSREILEMLETGIADGRLALKTVDEDFVQQTQAAGLRQRREGLAYRLTWRKRGLMPRKRVAPAKEGLTLRRKLVYRLRACISAWSHRVFWCARLLGWRGLYLRWARVMVSIYEGCTYLRGRWAWLFRNLDS